MCMPGDNTEMTVELIAPIAMDEGLRFAIREGGRTVGAGRVTKILFHWLRIVRLQINSGMPRPRSDGQREGYPNRR
jgi:hypothetical protein